MLKDSFDIGLVISTYDLLTIKEVEAIMLSANVPPDEYHVLLEPHLRGLPKA
jgi:hypothetical protein